jgi:hypothetical protein
MARPASFIYEPSLADGETRDQYLERFARVNSPAWTFLTDDEWAQIDRHVTTCDYSETSASMRQRCSAGANGSARLDLIAARYSPRIDVDLDDLADMLSVMADGGIILSRIVKDKDVLPRQVMLYRDFVRGIFLGA